MNVFQFLLGAASGAIGFWALAMTTKLLARSPRRRDPRLRKSFAGTIDCPQCGKILTGILVKFRFCPGPERDCFEFDGPHQHAECDGLGCGWKGIVKP